MLLQSSPKVHKDVRPRFGSVQSITQKLGVGLGAIAGSFPLGIVTMG